MFFDESPSQRQAFVFCRREHHAFVSTLARSYGRFALCLLLGLSAQTLGCGAEVHEDEHVGKSLCKLPEIKGLRAMDSWEGEEEQLDSTIRKMRRRDPRIERALRIEWNASSDAANWRVRWRPRGLPLWQERAPETQAGGCATEASDGASSTSWIVYYDRVATTENDLRRRLPLMDSRWELEIYCEGGQRKHYDLSFERPIACNDVFAPQGLAENVVAIRRAMLDPADDDGSGKLGELLNEVVLSTSEYLREHVGAFRRLRDHAASNITARRNINPFEYEVPYFNPSDNKPYTALQYCIHRAASHAFGDREFLLPLTGETRIHILTEPLDPSRHADHRYLSAATALFGPGSISERLGPVAEGDTYLFSGDQRVPVYHWSPPGNYPTGNERMLMVQDFMSFPTSQ